MPVDLPPVPALPEVVDVPAVPDVPPMPGPVATDEPAPEDVPDAAAEPVAEPEAVLDSSTGAQPAPEPDATLEIADEVFAAEAVVETAPEDIPDAREETGDVGDDVDVLPQIDVEIDADAAVPALRLSGVSKWFGQTAAVDAIDLTVPAGTFYGIVGPNGAGKTTTLSLIAGLLRPDAGSIEVAGIDLTKDPARAKRQMGILPDRLRTFDRLTGRQLLYYYGVLRGLRSAVVESRTADLARAFDLSDALGRKVSDYSTGMTKKIMLAGAMIHSPRVLVLDEPFESVDPVSSSVILDILSAYVEHGGTVVLSSHGMELVERVCSGVAVIVAGQVLAQGTLDEVRGGSTLEERFLELSSSGGDVEGLEWLHTFSD